MRYIDLLSLVATALTFIAFIPYIFGIHRNTIKPHVFSWAIWGLSTCVVFGAQLKDGGGAGAWPIGFSGAITVYIAVLAFFKKSDITIKSSDWFFFVIALLSLPLWYLTADPLWAVIILSTVGVLGFVPTWRKVHDAPHSESISFYAIFIVRNLMAIVALEHLSITTVLFPATQAIACTIQILVMQQGKKRPNKQSFI